MKIKFEIDYEGLEEYLLNLKESEIERYWNRVVNPKLVKATAMDDIEFFKQDIDKIPKEAIVDYGEPFLVDALGNDLSVLMLTRRKYKLPNGRVVRGKFIKTIIDDCRSVYGTSLNGYWKIPSQFVKQNK